MTLRDCVLRAARRTGWGCVLLAGGAFHVGAQTSVDQWTVSPTPDLRLGTLDGPELTLLVNPRDALQVGTSVAIGMYLNNFFALRYFDEDGQVFADVGGFGKGPFELSSPFMSLIRLPGDSILLLADERKILVFGPNGENVRTARLQLPGWQGGIRAVGMLDENSLLIRSAGFPFGPGVAEAEVVKVGVYDLSAEAGSVVATYEGGTIGFGSDIVLYEPMEPFVRVAAGEGRVWVSDKGGSEIRELIGGRSAVIPHDARPVTRAMRRTWAEAQTRGRTGPRLREIERHVARVDFPSHLPFVQYLDVDPDGNLWVMRFEPPSSTAPYHWDVFSPSGKWIAEVDAPFELLGLRPRQQGNPLVSTLMEIGNDYVLVRNEDELGVARVHRHRLTKGSR
ncbi:MAG: hypothetical protein HKN72_06050 [Gemmatimonadetes bacterium]|nr:hypothetical protein [Gemmatimonadota bacterium]